MSSARLPSGREEHGANLGYILTRNGTFYKDTFPTQNISDVIFYKKGLIIVSYLYQKGPKKGLQNNPLHYHNGRKYEVFDIFSIASSCASI